MLRNKKYTVSDCYSTRMCVFIILEMTPSYPSGIPCVERVSHPDYGECHGSPDTVTRLQSVFSKFLPNNWLKMCQSNFGMHARPIPRDI